MSDEDTPPEEIEHHGVKGQRWGVRKSIEGVGRAVGRDAADLNDKTKEYLQIVSESASKTISHREAAANLAKNKEKFAQKFAPSDGPVGGSGKGLSPRQKKLLLAGAGATIAVGGLYLLSKQGVKLNTIEELAHHPPGTHISVMDFQKLQDKSMMKTWAGKVGYVTKESLDRPAFELPAGHTFYRISTAAEKDFRIPPGTYALSSIEDFHRYVVGFSKEKGGEALHQIKFQSTAPVKVPHITDVLESTKEILSAEKGAKASSRDAINAYKAMSGGSWTGVREQKLFESLTKKGFGALVDEMDAGVIGEKPLVVFGNQFAGKSSQPFTKATLNAAAANLTEIGWRK